MEIAEAGIILDDRNLLRCYERATEDHILPIANELQITFFLLIINYIWNIYSIEQTYILFVFDLGFWAL